MHIAVGKFEGCVIEDSKTRGPLSTRELTVKEEIFNIVGSKISEAEVLDINDFNGICGIESLSRGAKKIYFVGDDLDSYRIIEKNLKKLKINEAVLVRENIREFLDNLKSTKKFDLIFFEVCSQSDVGMESKLVGRLTDSGFLFMTIPIFGGAFEVPKAIPGAIIQETRDCEQRVVLVIRKNHYS